jgi:probable phosphoglycerate mutase
MLFYLVRHGATDLNNDSNTSDDRIRGWKDVPLNEEGRQTARQTAEELKSKGIKLIVASDLSRSKETADIIAKILKITPTYTEKLRPWDLGIYTGKSTKDAIPEIKKYVDHPDKQVPKGEAFNTFKKRAFSGIADAIDKANDDKLCIVTHHRVERLLKAWIEAGQPLDGDVDLNLFVQKGEAPGHAEIITLDPPRLRNVRGEKVKGSIERAIREAS